MHSHRSKKLKCQLAVESRRCFRLHSLGYLTTIWNTLSTYFVLSNHCTDNCMFLLTEMKMNDTLTGVAVTEVAFWTQLGMSAILSCGGQWYSYTVAPAFNSGINDLEMKQQPAC